MMERSEEIGGRLIFPMKGKLSDVLKALDWEDILNRTDLLFSHMEQRVKEVSKFAFSVQQVLEVGGASVLDLSLRQIRDEIVEFVLLIESIKETEYEIKVCAMVDSFLRSLLVCFKNVAREFEKWTHDEMRVRKQSFDLFQINLGRAYKVIIQIRKIFFDQKSLLFSQIARVRGGKSKDIELPREMVTTYDRAAANKTRETARIADTQRNIRITEESTGIALEATRKNIGRRSSIDLSTKKRDRKSFIYENSHVQGLGKDCEMEIRSGKKETVRRYPGRLTEFLKKKSQEPE